MGEPVLFLSDSPEETERFGGRLGALLRPGDVVLLVGDLGSGKTVLVRGICRAFGCEGEVRSPTFVLVREYDGIFPVFHIDLYRLTGPGDWPNLGVEDRIAQGVALVEWGEMIESLFGGGAVVVEIVAGKDVNGREFRVRWDDPRLERLREAGR